MKIRVRRLMVITAIVAALIPFSVWTKKMIISSLQLREDAIIICNV